MGALEGMWSRMRRALRHDRREEVLTLLCREYLTQVKDSIQFRRHAEHMRYPQFRDKLLRIAEAEEKHAGRSKEESLRWEATSPKSHQQRKTAGTIGRSCAWILTTRGNAFGTWKDSCQWLSKLILKRRRCCVISLKTKESTMKPSSIC